MQWRGASAWFWLMTALLLIGGLAVRLFDLPDPPLGFHPTRQMRGALMARYLYFQLRPPDDPQRMDVVTQMVRERLGAYEPPIVEGLVALTYVVLGQEALWVARLYSVLFWTLAGWIVLRWVWKATGEPWAGWGALAYMLALPFTAKAGRSFQPDPLMTLLLVLAGYGWWSWLETGRRRDLGLGILSAALAPLVKPLALYFLGPLFLALALLRWKRFFWRKPVFWGIGLAILVPVAIFMLFFRGEEAGSLFQQWAWSLRDLWLDPKFYPRWMRFLAGLTGTGWVVLALIGWIVAPGTSRGIMTGWLAGYVLYGMLSPYHITSHNYYHLPFFPWIGLGTGMVWARLLPILRNQSRGWQGLALACAWAWILYGYAEAYTDLQDTWWDEAAYYQEVAQVIPSSGKLIGLVEHYGFPLAYYGERVVVPWPSRAEQALARLRGKDPAPLWQEFQERAEGFDYFIVTDFREWDRQPALREVLTSWCPLVVEQDNVLVFDLRACTRE